MKPLLVASIAAIPISVLLVAGAAELPRTGSPERILLGVRGMEVVSGTLHLRGDAVYELRSDLVVQGGDLVIDPGTRIESVGGAGITVGRSGRIIADGTLTLPIVLACDNPAPGCWSGLTVNGAARINSGTPTSPVIPGRDATGGCLEVVGANGAYGGCQDNDSSGVLRHIWIENGGASGAGLALRGVGSRTVIENVQVAYSGGSGFDLRGGTARLRYIRSIAADTAGLVWSEGWRGLAQFGVIQARSAARAAIDGGNQLVDPDALPRSAPTLRNFTIIGPTSLDVGSAAAGVRLHSGTGATLQSFVVANRPVTGAWAYDIDDAATWNRFANGELRFEHSYFIGLAPLGNLDVDPLGAAPGLFSPDVEGQILESVASSNRFVLDFDSVASQFKSPYGALQDLRPAVPGALFDASCTPPPGDPFFAPVSWCGAVETGLGTTVIPWYEPGPIASVQSVPSQTSYGFLYVLVGSNHGALGGIRLTASNFLGVTDPFGYARLYVPSGTIAYSLDNLPSICANPGIFVITVPAGGSAGQTAVVQCN